MSTRRVQLLAVLLVSSLLALGVLSRLAWEVLHGATQQQAFDDKYAVYIDGGSSGTRVRVFRYRPARWPSYVALALPEPSLAVEPGLSAYATQPGKAADSLRPLLDFAYEHVPVQQWSTTPVRLLATAGLRLLTEQQQADILTACRALLEASHFLFQPGWATVIGGELEGLYGWAAVNFLNGALQEAARHAHHSRKEVLDPSQLFTGLLEMGGASMQVTFLPLPAARLPSKYGSQLHLPGVPSRLFTHSYLGLGMDSALARAAEYVLERRPGAGAVLDPCLPIGYTSEDGRTGNASFVQCLAVVREILPEHDCSTLPESSLADETFALPPSSVSRRRAAAAAAAPSMSLAGGESHSAEFAAGQRAPGGGCTLQGSFVPALWGPFLAVENFAWTARALGLPVSATLRELREHGKRYCARHWSSLHAEFSGHIPDQFLVRYCFGAAYILALLHSGLGLGLDDSRLTWTNTVQERSSGAEVGLNWVLGAAVVDAMNSGGGGGNEGGGGAGGGATGSQRFWQLDAGGMSGGAVRAALLLPLLALLVLAGVLLVALLGGFRSGGKAPRPAAAAMAVGMGPGGIAAGGDDGVPGRSTSVAALGRQGTGRGGGLGIASNAWSSSALSTSAVAAAAAGVASTASLRGSQQGLDACSLDPGLGSEANPSTGPWGSGVTGGRSASRPAAGPRGSSPPRQDLDGGQGAKHSGVLRAQGAAMRRAPSYVSVFMGSDIGGGQ